MNDNLEYLDERITEVSAEIYSNNSSLESKIDTLSLALDNTTEELENKINDNNESNTAQIGEKASKTFEDVAEEAKALACQWMMPNYSKGQNISSGYTATKHGWIYMGGIADGTSSFTINGAYFEVCWDTGDGQSRGNVFMPVSKGDVISSFNRIREARFYPCQGV